MTTFTNTESNAAAGAIAGAAAGAFATGGTGGNVNADLDINMPDDYGSDDDVIDADQTNNGDNQANAVNSTINQSDDDGDRNDNRSDDDINVTNALNGAGDHRDNDSSTHLDADNVLNGAGNNRDNDNSTDVDVSDVLNGAGNNRDNDSSMDLDVDISDSFRDDDSDDDLIDFDDVGGFEIDSLLADALNGAGNDMAFSIDQANDMIDNDIVNSPNVSYNGGSPGGGGGTGGEGDAGGYHGLPADGGMGGSAAGGFYQTATAQGGHAEMGNFSAGGASGGAGHDAIALNSTTSADASLTQEAFTQNLTLGANIQYNLSEMAVVGGNSSDTGDADDAA